MVDAARRGSASKTVRVRKYCSRCFISGSFLGIVLLRLWAVEALRQSRGCGVAERKWVSAQRVRRERGPVQKVGGGFHGDDLVGLTRDGEPGLVRNDAEVDQR